MDKILIETSTAPSHKTSRPQPFFRLVRPRPRLASLGNGVCRPVGLILLFLGTWRPPNTPTTTVCPFYRGFADEGVFGDIPPREAGSLATYTACPLAAMPFLLGEVGGLLFPWRPLGPTSLAGRPSELWFLFYLWTTTRVKLHPQKEMGKNPPYEYTLD